LHAFAKRIRARRGNNVAAIAVARKLCVVFWHLLTRGEDYAYARPSLTKTKLRRLELLAGDPPRRGQRGVITKPYRLQEVRERERELAQQAEHAYERLVADWKQTRPKGAGVTPGRASLKGPRRAKPRGRPQAPDVCASLRQSPAPNANCATGAAHRPAHLTFIRRLWWS